MKKRAAPGNRAALEALRAKAEDVLHADVSMRTTLFNEAPTSLADALRLVHELQVHRIELEMQNEELLTARTGLEQAVALYAELYDSAPVGYFTLAGDGNIQQANVVAARMIGIGRPILVPLRLAAFLPPADRSSFAAALDQVRATGAVASCEVSLSRTSTLLELIISAPDAESYRVIATDVTARKNVEGELRTALKMDAIGRLAGGVAHDFNNLLTVILGHTAFALEEAQGEAVREDLQTIENAAKHAADLTRQLLAFSRKQVLRPAVVDVNQLVAGLATMLRRLLGEPIRLVHELFPDTRRVKVDAVQLEQIVMNLTINARDAMPDGGSVTITTRNLEASAQREIPALASKRGPFVMVSVSDTGVGMDDATMRLIFEPFFTTKTKDRGTGFGLATVYGIVKQCGGEIRVASEPGRGSTFEVFLPCASADDVAEAERGDEQRAASPRSILPSAVAGETVLVVEDEPALRTITKRILSRAGYAVLLAATGEEALEICLRTPAVQLVLSDVVMTTMNGVVLAERLKKLRPELPVLHMSGYTDEAIERHGGIDPDRFITKPFSGSTLTRKVHEVLALSRAPQSSPRLPGAQ